VLSQNQRDIATPTFASVATPPLLPEVAQMDKLITALAPVFAAGFAVQQLLEILTSFFDAWQFLQKYKKLILGLISLVIGVALAFGVDALRVLQPLFTDAAGKATASVPPLLDHLVTALVISAGTEGVNSILKFLKYSKEDKKTDAAGKLEPAGGAAPAAHPAPTADALSVVNKK
jgi:hypothetical protein